MAATRATVAAVAEVGMAAALEAKAPVAVAVAEAEVAAVLAEIADRQDVKGLNRKNGLCRAHFLCP